MNRIKNYLLQTITGELFFINKDNQFVFRKGYFKGHSIDNLYLKFKDDLIEYLDMIYNDCNIKDKRNIKEIKKNLR